MRRTIIKVLGFGCLSVTAFGVILVLGFVTMLKCLPFPGDPGTEISVDNRTDQELSFFIDNLRQADISPHKVLKFDTMAVNPSNVYLPDTKFLIEAKTKEGKVVFSKEFLWQELKDMNWKIVIPP